MAKNTEEEDLLDLVYPTYLDVPMLTSFVAALMDGIALESQEITTSKTTTEKTKTIQSKASLASLFNFLTFDANGQLEGQKGSSLEHNVTLSKKHSETSLFIRLRKTLIETEQLLQLDYISENDFSKVHRSSLIEISGSILQDPLQDIINFFEQLKSYVDFTNQLGLLTNQPPTSSSSAPQQKKTNTGNQVQQNRPANVKSQIKTDIQNFIKFVEVLKADLSRAPIKDVVLNSGVPHNGSNVKLIAHLSRDFLPKNSLDEETLEHLKYGEFTLLGKVAFVGLESTEKINLLRRSAIGRINSVADSLILELSKLQILQISDLPSIYVEPPYIEVIPLAIYV